MNKQNIKTDKQHSGLDPILNGEALRIRKEDCKP